MVAGALMIWSVKQLNPCKASAMLALTSLIRRFSSRESAPDKFILRPNTLISRKQRPSKREFVWLRSNGLLRKPPLLKLPKPSVSSVKLRKQNAPESKLKPPRRKSALKQKRLSVLREKQLRRPKRSAWRLKKPKELLAKKLSELRKNALRQKRPSV